MSKFLVIFYKEREVSSASGKRWDECLATFGRILEKTRGGLSIVKEKIDAQSVLYYTT